MRGKVFSQNIENFVRCLDIRAQLYILAPTDGLSPISNEADYHFVYKYVKNNVNEI